MTDIYAQLAKHLDKLPAGFPATASGVEHRILKRLFSEEEASIALGLTMTPEPAAVIAKRLNMDEGPLDAILDQMSRKGLIYRSSKNGVNSYMAAQFVIGIWEYHLNRLDKELIRDVNEYLPHFMQKSWVQHETKQLRVIPISKNVTAEITTMPYEVAEDIIAAQNKIVVSDCICRKEHTIVGNRCDSPMEVCFSFGSGAYYYEENGLGRSIEKAEALKILELGREAGLVLQPGNARKPANICMCCACCCQVLKNVKRMEKPAYFVHSNYYSQADEESCVVCGTCTEKCPMDAITVGDVAHVDLDRCIGCGVCITQCPTGALVYKQKEPADQYVPPANLVETYMKMAMERSNL